MTLPSLSQTAFLQALISHLDAWFQSTPLFATHPGAASLHQHVTAARTPNGPPAAILAQLQHDLVRLQIAFHEAGHAAAAYALTSENDVWDIHLWFASDLNLTAGEGHAGRTHVTERQGWPETRAEVQAKLTIMLAGVLFHPKIRGVQFTGSEACDEKTALVLADQLGWSLQDAYADARQQLDLPEVRDAVADLAAEAFGRLAIKQYEVEAQTTAKILSDYLQRPSGSPR